MNIYIHEGCGHYIGSAVVCLAESEEQAAQMVRKYLDDNGLPKEAVNLRLDVNDYEPGIVYARNGDY